DSNPTTHPIVADITDLEAARQNFDGITYAKGAAVIKQLFHYVGGTAFLEACRVYFQRYSFGSAQLADFLNILEEASGRDMATWSSYWLQTSGPATISAKINDAGEISLHQEATDPITGQTVLRPHDLFVSVFICNADRRLIKHQEQHVVIESGQATIPVENIVVPNDQPRIVVVNHHDHTYAQVALDEASLQGATNHPIDGAESTAVATIWSTLWTMVREDSLPATHFVQAAAKLSNDVEDVSMHGRLLEQAVSAVKEFTPASKRKRMTKELGTALMDALVTLDPGSDRQRSAARALTQLG